MILMNAIIQFMKRHYKILLIVVVLSVGLWSFMPKLSVSDPEKDKTLIELLTFVLEKGHYNPAVIDDSFSKQVYTEYINALDPSKRFLLQSDIDEFAKYETRIDDAIRNKDLTFFDLTYNRLVKRMNLKITINLFWKNPLITQSTKKFLQIMKISRMHQISQL